MRPIVEVYDDETGEAVKLPTKWAICSTCRGNGTHVDPAVDGWDPSDWEANDEYFRENYFAGTYDQRCEDCGGTGKVQEVDESRLTPAQHGALNAAINDRNEMEAISRQERMMGA